MAQFFDDMKLTVIKAASVAGTTLVTSDAVNMSGYEGVLLFTTVGAITPGAATSVKVQQSSDDSSYADLAGTSITIADDDDGQLFGVEIVNPGKQYLKFLVSRATQTTIVGELYALQYGAGHRPITHNVTDKSTFETYVSPAEGTA